MASGPIISIRLSSARTAASMPSTSGSTALICFSNAGRKASSSLIPDSPSDAGHDTARLPNSECARLHSIPHRYSRTLLFDRLPNDCLGIGQKPHEEYLFADGKLRRSHGIVCGIGFVTNVGSGLEPIADLHPDSIPKNDLPLHRKSCFALAACQQTPRLRRKLDFMLTTDFRVDVPNNDRLGLSILERLQKLPRESTPSTLKAVRSTATRHVPTSRRPQAFSRIVAGRIRQTSHPAAAVTHAREAAPPCP